MIPRKGLVAALAVLAFVAGSSCGSKKSATAPNPPGETGDDRLMMQQGDVPAGLAIRLSEGKDGDPGEARPPVLARPEAKKLDASQVKDLLARLAPLAGQAGDEKDFALRERSRPAPRTGTTILGQFPPPASATAPAAGSTETGPLSVLRFAPQGDVPIAPHLSVTFSQPMIAVSSHADATAESIPVKLTPMPRGSWRWLGTRTLMFDPDVRFPQATAYKAEIPAGTRSATGNTLAQAVTFSFTTPAPRVIRSWPDSSGPQKRVPAMAVELDQAIDAQAVIKTISVSAGATKFPVRALTRAEIEKDQAIRSFIAAAEQSEHKGRYVAFTVSEPLPADAAITVNVGPGTPSAEGPLTTTSVQSFSFRTYGPLKVEEARCSYGNQCPPLTPWFIRFSNPLDLDKLDTTAIRVSPELPGLRIDPSGSFMSIRGRSKGRTTYTVTLPASLPDEFGQTLGKEETLTFRVGSADPRFWGPSGLVVLDPASSRRSLGLFSINVKEVEVRLYKVTPADWAAFARYMADPYDRSTNSRKPVLKTPPGTKVVDTKVSVGGATDEMTETAIDLSPALSPAPGGGLGHVVAVIQPADWPRDDWKPVISTWAQATGIGLDAFVDDTDLIGWATRLADGSPLANVSLEVRPMGASGRTGEDGVARIGLVPGAKPGRVLVASQGPDTAFLPENVHWWNDHGGWSHRTPGESLRWYVFDDRAMYRPGEEVHVKGWLRRIGQGEGGDLMPLNIINRELSYVVYGPRGNDLFKGKATLNAAGGFDFDFKLPATPNLGWARIELFAAGASDASDRSYSHGFQIQEFRRPEFEVTAQASQGPHMVGSGADVTLKASYYAGGGLPGADVSWTVSSAPSSFTPPNRDDFVFGTWTPWWGYHRWGPPGPQAPGNTVSLAGKTDAVGQHVLHMDFLSASPPQPMQVTAEASVMDVNRQAWSASTSLLVHPAALYVGIKRDRYFAEQGKPIELDAIVVDHDGKAVAGKALVVRAVRLDWAYEKGSYVTKEVSPQTCELTSAAEPVHCSFKTDEGGEYRITAEIRDDHGRPNQTRLTTWVAGGAQPVAQNVELEQVTIIPDKKEYRPGDTAELLVQSPLSPAEALVSVRRSGIVSTERISLTGPTATVRVPVVEGHIPNVFVQVDVVGSAVRLSDDGKPMESLPRRPAFASGSIDLSVPPLSRTLAVSAEPRARKLAPGGETAVDIVVRDAAGKPVAGAEVAVVVVDESVLALSGYKLPDPIDVFYSKRPPGGSDHHLRSNVTLARPELELADADGAGADQDVMEGSLAMAEEAPMAAAAPPGRAMAKSRSAGVLGAMRGGGQAEAPIAVRKSFNALAVFAPAVPTDAQGKAVVPVKVPDNLTRYRVMAVAVAGDKHFGKGESSITARMPLMVRPSPPRFLNFGDTFELPVVVQNQTDEPMSVRVAVRTHNAALTDGQGRALTVPPNDRAEVRFPAAAELPGTMRLQVAAAAGTWADAAEMALPVWTPATTEAFATYGEIDAGAIRQPVAMPGAVIKELGGLEITTSSTQLQALTDALLYLVHYPYECAEQVSSRIIAVAALRDVLTAFDAGGMPSPAELMAAVERDMVKLKGMQNHDGGFGYWRPGVASVPYVSIHVAHALSRARDKGFVVPGDMMTRAGEYLQSIEQHIPSWYPEEVRRTLVAYALYVRARMGDRDPRRANKLFAEAGLDKLPLEAVGWLLAVLSGDSGSAGQVAAIHELLGNRATETAAAASFASSYSDGAYLLLHSRRRADAIILESLIIDKPASDLIPKLVRGLLGHRTRGRWQNTQENAFVLLALDRYFNVFEKVTPSFVARVWLGDRFAGEHAFRGRSTESHQIDIPMSYVADMGKGDLILQKDGKGRLYYRIGMTYAPASLALEPADHGFAVQRRYEAVDDAGDVSRMADGTWKIKAGARVRVRLSMVAESRRYHVALVDPLPAGLEPMNPALAVTGAIPQDPSQSRRSSYWWWTQTWYEHQNMRDERVEAFASLLWDGVHEYSYVARATTPGVFVVPPAKAEEMYYPETFGRSASTRVIVE